VNFSVPSNTEDTLGSDEPIIDAFATVGVHFGPAAWMAHVGHSWNTDIGNLDNVVWGTGLHGAAGEWVALRTEVIGRHLDDVSEGGQDVVAFEPGVDPRIAAIRTFDLIFRPTGSVGLRDEAPDWELGGSIVSDFDPFGSGGES
jgi:hypothetical protein